MSFPGLRKESDKISFRWAMPLDFGETMKMVWKTFLKFEAPDYEEEGIMKFYEFITDEALYKSFLRGDYRIMVALHKDKIVGMGSIRNGNFLSLLFVDEAYHKKGIATEIVDKLCTFIKKHGEDVLIVKSSPYARGFYEKLGFVSTGDELKVAGIRVFPMEIEIGDKRNEII